MWETCLLFCNKISRNTPVTAETTELSLEDRKGLNPFPLVLTPLGLKVVTETPPLLPDKRRQWADASRCEKGDVYVATVCF